MQIDMTACRSVSAPLGVVFLHATLLAAPEALAALAPTIPVVACTGVVAERFPEQQPRRHEFEPMRATHMTESCCKRRTGCTFSFAGGQPPLLKGGLERRGHPHALPSGAGRRSPPSGKSYRTCQTSPPTSCMPAHRTAMLGLGACPPQPLWQPPAARWTGTSAATTHAHTRLTLTSPEMNLCCTAWRKEQLIHNGGGQALMLPRHQLSVKLQAACLADQQTSLLMAHVQQKEHKPYPMTCHNSHAGL